MGEHDIREGLEGGQLRHFHKRLPDDLYALEHRLDQGLFETDIRRIGAEQELFLADQAGHPHATALDLLKRVDDPHFTTELALFNLEINLDPVPLKGDGLNRMENQLGALIAKARATASEIGTDLVMTGILPSLRGSDMNMDNMTPLPRYEALNRSVQALRGGPLECSIRGVLGRYGSGPDADQGGAHPTVARRPSHGRSRGEGHRSIPRRRLRAP